MAGHSHDGIDWDERLQQLREDDELVAPETSKLVRHLLRTEDRSVIDVGAGAGGTAAAFAAALPGGHVTVVDSADELLGAAGSHARQAAGEGVEIRTVRSDAADDELLDRVEPADLVFASLVVHHLPDERAGLRRFSQLVRPGGRLVVVETGLSSRVLSWDVGVGPPGLEDRLARCRQDWFREMRTEMPGSVRTPVGWSRAMSEVGLTDVGSWSYLIDRPAPLSGVALNAVVRRLEWLHSAAQERASAEDLDALEQLLDPRGPHYVGLRDDVHYLVANTVHVGTRPVY